MTDRGTPTPAEEVGFISQSDLLGQIDQDPAFDSREKVLPVDVFIPEGFDLALFNTGDDRYAEDGMPYSSTDVLRREPDSTPRLLKSEVVELLEITRRIAELDDQIAPLERERKKMASRAIAIAKGSNGNRGAGFEDLGDNVNVAPSYERSVVDIPRFREQMGALFGITGYEVVGGKVIIPPDLKTKDGSPVTGVMVIQCFDILLDALGISEEDRLKLLKGLKPSVEIELPNWRTVAQEIAGGRLDPDTVTAKAKWGVKTVDRKGASGLESDPQVDVE